MKNILFKTSLFFLSICMMASCEDDNDKRITGGKPVVSYVRQLSTDLPDNLVTKASLGARLAIIGTDLAGVDKIYFNDVQAVINPAYITETAIIVTLPTTIPGVKENLLKVYTSEDSCYYDFEVVIPAPTVKEMGFEWADIGEETNITGSYFIDDPVTPLTVSFTGGVNGEIVDFSLNSIAVKIPEGAQEGPVTVTSAYGSTVSKFWYHDSRNIFGDFNNGFSPDYDYFNGWHGGAGISTEGGINGNYLIMTPTITGKGGSADDTNNCYDKLCYNPDEADYVDASKIDNYALKFEAKVSGNWSAGSLQVIFTGPEEAWCNWQSNTNWPQYPHSQNEDWKRSTAYPRVLWTPWEAAGGVYNSDWTTVTIPMSDCKYGWPDSDGNVATVAPKGVGHYKGFTMIVANDGKNGTDCHPTIWIDNVRIVSTK
jgi:hypothetical protein